MKIFRGVLLPALLCCTLAPAVPAGAETIRAVATSGDLIRAIQLKRDGGDLLIPLLACGPLLGADARWIQSTNQWALHGKGVEARGFLDEPLMFVGGQPLLVKAPPRLIGRIPYLSLEALRLLGRHGWDTDVVWDEPGRKLVIQPAQLLPAEAGGRTRALAVPQVPAGARVLVIDAGHPRREGARGLHGLTEGDLGLRLAQALSATLTGTGILVVILQDGDDLLEPRDVAGLANAMPADLFLAFHGSEYGEPGVTLWIWGESNLLGSGISYEAFEPAGGWARAAAAAAPRSAAMARRLLRGLTAAQIPAHGPVPAPLIGLEGLNCPALTVDVQALATPAGATLAGDDAVLQRLTDALASVLRAELLPAPPRDAGGVQP